MIRYIISNNFSSWKLEETEHRRDWSAKGGLHHFRAFKDNLGDVEVYFDCSRQHLFNFVREPWNYYVSETSQWLGLSVGRLVYWSICRNFLKGREVSVPLLLSEHLFVSVKEPWQHVYARNQKKYNAQVLTIYRAVAIRTGGKLDSMDSALIAFYF